MGEFGRQEMTQFEVWKDKPDGLETHTEYLSDTTDWEVIILDTNTKEIARLVVMPKEKTGRFLGIITKGDVKVIKSEIQETK